MSRPIIRVVNNAKFVYSNSEQEIKSTEIYENLFVFYIILDTTRTILTFFTSIPKKNILI